MPLAQAKNNIPSDDAYLYHATNVDNAYHIAREGLKPFKPSYGTDQTSWPDGHTNKRIYFSLNAHTVWQFVPTEGRSCVLRVPRSLGLFRHETGTGDVYSEVAIAPKFIQVLKDDGSWVPLTQAALSEATEMPPVLKTVCAWCGKVLSDGPKDGPISHGICDACAKKFMGEGYLIEHIVKLPNGRYRLLSHTGKNLGTFDSHGAAAKHEGEVEYFKHEQVAPMSEEPGYTNDYWRYWDPEKYKEWVAKKKAAKAAREKAQANTQQESVQSFSAFLLEERMSREEAMIILGLKPGFTDEDLKKAYRTASIQHHPDRGGDVQMMQKVNVAHDTLKQGGGRMPSSGVGSQSWYVAYEERANAAAEIAKKAINDQLDTHAFIKHFEAIFGEPFTLLPTDWKVGSMSAYVSREFEYANASRTIVLSFSIGVDLSDLLRTKSMGNPETGLRIGVYSQILVNRKEIKLTQSKFNWTNRIAALHDPEVLFPSMKLKNRVVSAQQKTSISKRDVLLTLKKQLNAKDFGGDNYAIRAGKFQITLYRSRLMRAAFWAVHSVKDMENPKAGSERPTTAFIEESKVGIDMLIDRLVELQAYPPSTITEVIRRLDDLTREYKEYRERER